MLQDSICRCISTYCILPEQSSPLLLAYSPAVSSILCTQHCCLLYVDTGHNSPRGLSLETAGHRKSVPETHGLITRRRSRRGPKGPTSAAERRSLWSTITVSLTTKKMVETGMVGSATIKPPSATMADHHHHRIGTGGTRLATSP